MTYGYHVNMIRTLTAAVHREEELYVARALEVEVASQGESIQEALSNLREALDLYFEGNEAGLELEHPLVTTLEVGGAA